MERATIYLLAGMAVIPPVLALTLYLTQVATQPAMQPVPPVGDAAARRSVEQQFGMRFCFKQYSNAADITACLARYVQ